MYINISGNKKVYIYINIYNIHMRQKSLLIRNRQNIDKATNTTLFYDNKYIYMYKHNSY